MAASRRVRAPKPLALWLASVALHGCTLVLDVEDSQCTTNADCVGLFGREFVCTPQRVCTDESSAAPDGGGDSGGGELPPEWQCIEEPRPPLIMQANRSLTLSLAVTDFESLTQPDGLIGRACNENDVDCSSPRIDNVMPNEDGYLRFEELPYAWIGFIELDAPDYIQTLVFTNKPYTVDAQPEGPTLLTESTLRTITEGGGETLDETKGVVLVAVYDCDGKPAEGVSFRQELREGEEVEQPFYFEGSYPDRDRPSTLLSTRLTGTRNPLAVGGFSQVGQGYQTIVGILAATGQEIGRVTVQVRPLTMSIAELHAGY